MRRVALSALMIGLGLMACDDGDGGGGDPRTADSGTSCVNDQRRCTLDSASIEICVGGVWAVFAACDADQTCTAGECVDTSCTPNCTGRACGSDGCDGVCGECEAGFTCSLDGQCQPPAARCGDDACNGDETCSTCPADCGNCCGDGQCSAGMSENCATCLADCACDGQDVCNADTRNCESCEPQCTGRECGDDGCGGECGACPGGAACVSGLCDVGCEPQCDGRQCGDDGCDGVCGQCAGDDVCNADGQCEAQPDQCGDNVCGDGEDCANCPADCGQCCGNGECAGGENCATCPADCGCPDGERCEPERRACVAECVPQCAGRNCGPDGCGGVCGECGANQDCEMGVCTDRCVPACDGRECGGDGCGGRCGECPDGELCDDGSCEQICMPNCEGRTCGPDGCGGFCGDCAMGQNCDEMSGQCVDECVPRCDGLECGPDGCMGECGRCDGDAMCRNGQCVDDGAFCDCAADEVCLDGFCRGEEQLCSDENPVGLCATGSECVVGDCVARGGACSPANPNGVCELGEVCRDGVCAPFDGAALCDDANSCTADAFDHVRNQCVNRPQAADCDDGNGCTENRCEDGRCVAERIPGCIEPPTIEPYDTPTNNNDFRIAGTKPGGSSIRINGQEAVAENPDENWFVDVNLVPGENVFRVRSVDGGQQSAEVVVRVVYDIDSPTVRVTPGGGIFLNGVTVTVASSEPATVYYTDDGGTPDRWSRSFRSVKQFRVFDDTVLRFRALDEAGNWQEEIETAEFEITGYGNGWTPGPNLPEPRTLAGVTLHQGNVWLIGGTDGLASQAGVFFMPEAGGDWEAGPALPIGRASLAAVSLGNHVYAIGGEDQGLPLNLNQRLAPGGMWENRAPMPSTRFGLAAVVADGRIWAFGGKTNGNRVLDNVEVYNPGNDTWSNQFAQMPRPRYGLAALHHDGRIYLIGGEDAAGNPIAEVDVYTIATDEWAQVAELPTPRSFLSVGLNQNIGRITGGYTGIVAAGGVRAGGAASVQVEEFVIDAGHWRTRTQLPAPRHSAGALWTDTDAGVDSSRVIWMVGGQVGDAVSGTTAQYVQEHDYATRIAEMPEGRFLHAAEELDGLIYLFGGRDFQETTVVWSFDPETGRYQEITELPNVQRGLASASFDGRIWAFGGANNFNIPVPWARSYVPATREWTEHAPMQSARTEAAVAHFNGEVYLIGGDNNGALQSVEIYNPATDEWRAGPVLPQGRKGATAVVWDDSIVLIGGYTSDDQPVEPVLRFRNNQWGNLGVNIPIAYATGALMHDRQVTLFGGRDRGSVSTQMISLNLSNRRITQEAEGPDRFFSAVDRAASAYYNGHLYIFGGNTAREPGPNGTTVVQKIDSTCFNGVQDPGETGDGVNNYDRGGNCPVGSPNFVGVQTNVREATLIGWRRCFLNQYNQTTPMAEMTGPCNGTDIILACRRTNSPTLSVLAQGPRDQVFRNSGGIDVNGVRFYYSTSRSMGFASAGRPLSLNSCDTNQTGGGGDRMCWHTSGSRLTSGYRCGVNNVGAGWERVVYTR